MKTIFKCMLILIALFSMVGCSTTGSISHDTDLTKYEYVFFSESISVFDQKYLSEIQRMLERNGFKITSNKSEKRPLQCKFAIDQSNIFGFRVHISLWDGKKMLAVSEATNSGWGTLIARETAVRDLVNRTVVELEKQMQSKLRSSPK